MGSAETTQGVIRASSGHVETVRVLLAEPGVDVDLANTGGDTAMSLARTNRDAAVVAMLEGADAR